MSFKSRKFSLMELSKGKAVVFMWSGRCVCVWTLSFSVPLQRNTEVCVWRGHRIVFMVLLRHDILKTLHTNLISSLSVFPLPLPFSTPKRHILYRPFPPLASHPLLLHPSAPENVNWHGFKYAHSALGVNHHFVFITCSLSSLSRCAGGMTNWGVRKYSCCFWLQSSFFQWALSPRGCGSSALVFWTKRKTLIGSRAVPRMPVNSSDLINH